MREVLLLFLLSVVAVRAQLALDTGTPLAGYGTVNEGLGWETPGVSGDGKTVAFGSPHSGTGGIVKVYKKSSSTGAWSAQTIFGAAAGARFGVSVSVSGDGLRMVVGSSFLATNGGSQNGGVFVYSFSGGTWTETGSFSNYPTGYRAGYLVSFSYDGSTFAVIASGAGAPFFYAYRLSGSVWTAFGTVPVKDATYGSLTMSTDGTRVAISYPQYSAFAGNVKVFSYSAGSWTETGAPGIIGCASCRHGQSMSFPSDPDVMVVGSGGGVAEIYTLVGGSSWSNISTFNQSPYSGTVYYGSKISISQVCHNSWRILLFSD